MSGATTPPPAPAAHDDWDRHWDDYSASVSENPAQIYRRTLASALLERTGDPLRLVDVGSGQGDFLRAAAQRWPNAQLLGLEYSASGVAESERKVPGARFLQRDLLAAPDVPDGLGHWGTHALCSEVLEHVDDPVALLRGAREYLAPGCRLVVTVPGGSMSAFDRHIGHRQHFTPESLSQILREAGFDVALAGGAGWPFFNLYRRLVVLRGDKLVDDVLSRDAGPSPLARAAMLAFRPLFALNLPRTPWGVQIVAVAYASARPA
jgi:SAM-dependent methyltransferase